MQLLVWSPQVAAFVWWSMTTIVIIGGIVVGARSMIRNYFREKREHLRILMSGTDERDKEK